MKIHSVCLAYLGLLLPVGGQGNDGVSLRDQTVSKWEVEIPEPIADGTPAKPAAKQAPGDFKVIKSRTGKMDVVKAPEMGGLPPITGKTSVTVQFVEAPQLPAPPEPLPPLNADDPAVVARMAELREIYQGTSLVFISASVYDHKRTLLRIHANGGTADDVTAWSNLDFNHFGGFSTYRVKDGVDGTIFEYGMLMGIGNEGNGRSTEQSSKSNQGDDPPIIPKLPDLAGGGPAFVVVEGKDGSPAMDTLEQLHDLYRKEGARMEEAWRARETARAARNAYLLANPPKPEDVTIRFWKGPSRATLPSGQTTGE